MSPYSKNFLSERTRFDVREMRAGEHSDYCKEWELIKVKKSKLHSATRKRITRIMKLTAGKETTK